MLSTPLICCSIGVATACSIVSASAPTYVAWICVSGGAMLGNWAMGRLAIVTAPTITIRIDITIATMGRLMKKFTGGSAVLIKGANLVVDDLEVFQQRSRQL